MNTKNERLIKVTPVWSAWVIAGKKGERGIMKVGFVGDVL